MPRVYAAIDAWRQYHGGSKAYIAKHSMIRRQAEVERLSAQGMAPAQIAKAVGLSTRQVYRKRSSYLD